MSDFHLKTELEGDPDQQKNRMAEAIELGLRHCATDPMIRFKMIVGETYAEVGPVIERLTDKLAKENDAVRKLAVDATVNGVALFLPDRKTAHTMEALIWEALYELKTRQE